MPKFRLNPFALPSQTVIFFWLIAATLLGAMVIGLSGAHIIPMWPIAILLLFLPIREFFLRPNREIQKYGLRKAGNNEFVQLQQRITQKTREIRLQRVPQLLIDEKRPQEIYVMGTFTRWYLVLGLEKADRLEAFLEHPHKALLADVQILHELHHFKNGDFWQLGYLAELFKSSFGLMIWVFLFFVGWGLILVLAKDAIFQFSVSDVIQKIPPESRSAMETFLTTIFPSPEEMAMIKEKADSLNLFAAVNFVSNISIPYIFLTAVLWLFYRPRLWRVREFYADAGVVMTQKSTKPFVEFVCEGKKMPIKAIVLPVYRSNPYRLYISEIRDTVRKFVKGDFWPDFAQRLNALRMPETIFYNWKQTAWFLGSLVLLLEIFLATPLSLPVYGQNPMSFPTIITLAGLAYFVLPQIVMGKNAFGDGLKVLSMITALRIAWLLLTLALLWGTYFIAPSVLQDVLQSAITSTARYAGIDSLELALGDFLVEASILNILQIPIVFAIQIVSFSLLLFSFRRILRWYTFVNTPTRFKRMIFGVSLGLCFVLLVLIMPMSMSLLKGEFPALFWPIIGILTIIGLGGWLYYLDKLHYLQCPSGHRVEEPSIILGAICPQCATPLSSWLVVDEN